jgi:hypothetical protein
MKKILASCVLSMLALIAAGAASIAASNAASIITSVAPSGALPKFEGNWTLNRGKSEGLTGALANAEIKLVVLQDSKTITTEQKVIIKGREQSSQEFVYNLDGSESTADVVRPLAGTMYLKAKWVESTKILELSAKITGDNNGREATITTRERWQLMENGKALEIIRIRESPQGRQLFKFHYDREE